MVWMAVHDCLPTNVLRHQRRLSTSNLCRRSSNMPESTLHCLRDCNQASIIWNKLGFSTVIGFFNSDLYFLAAWEWHWVWRVFLQWDYRIGCFVQKDYSFSRWLCQLLPQFYWSMSITIGELGSCSSSSSSFLHPGHYYRADNLCIELLALQRRL